MTLLLKECAKLHASQYTAADFNNNPQLRSIYTGSPSSMTGLCVCVCVCHGVSVRFPVPNTLMFHRGSSRVCVCV